MYDFILKAFNIEVSLYAEARDYFKEASNAGFANAAQKFVRLLLFGYLSRTDTVYNRAVGARTKLLSAGIAFFVLDSFDFLRFVMMVFERERGTRTNSQ